MAIQNISPFFQQGQPSTGGSTTKRFAPEGGALRGLFNATSNKVASFTGANQYPGYRPVGSQARSPYDNATFPTNLLAQSQVKTQTFPTQQSTQGGMSSSGVSSTTMQPPNPYGQGGTPTNNAQTGGVALPPGMKVDERGNVVPISSPQNTPSTLAPINPSLSGILPQLLSLHDPNNPLNTAINQRTSDIQNLQNQLATQTANLQGSGIDLSLATGQEGILNRLFAAKYGAAQQALGTAVTNRQQQIGALQGAAQLATPAQVPYNVQYVSPVTGQSVAGSETSGLVASIPSLAQSVASGQMTPEQANAYLGNTTGLTDRLRAAVLQINPNYNFTLGTASGQTQAQGQQLQTSAQSANQALDMLQTAYSNLGALQQTNIPILNQIASGISEQLGIGRTQTSNYEGALNEARAQIQTVLAPLIGVDAAKSNTLALLPDNMVPTEVPQKIAAAREYIRQRVEAFVQSGKQSGQQSFQPSNTTDPFSFESFWQ